jgi:hypothetical protein
MRGNGLYKVFTFRIIERQTDETTAASTGVVLKDSCGTSDVTVVQKGSLAGRYVIRHLLKPYIRTCASRASLVAFG